MRAIYSDHGRVQGMLDFEAALARAEASSGLIPQAAVAPIASACQAERYDFAALAQAIVTAGNSAIPLVKALGKQVAAQSAEAERYVHLGATSQNAMDSGLVLQLRAAITLLEQDLAQLATALARELDLQLPEQPWHTQRDRLVEFASLLGLLGLIAGSLGKFGRDLSLLMQTEAGEVFEAAAPGKGGSSTMPHKRNPVGAAVLIGAATRAPGLVATMFSAMPQEHERSLGLWHAEWDTLPELCCLVSGALQQALQLVPGLEVDAARMRSNLDLTQGLVLAEAVSIALAQRIGRDAAHHLLEQCCQQAVREGVHLRQVLGSHAEVSAQLSASELDHLLDPALYLGQARRWVERAVAEHRNLSN
ncbi:lyase family protein [Pseudomonas aeruginosa]|uniref:lyase family protein n=1 Tax=Pseudomonas aeruginosa TaxID=287 RepID=UPI00293860B2|nr:3-carboxy-cis,cis-muconate cycloisomerase [Pseudomonas aeruginosa]HBO5831652.1 3-carboxy-cis,cis-muconate cycloisomerase [Pseudomonas aeruginosa]HEK2442448.1 3-carboxy-cis,cis-muconate cycloisomerase [Pseudomonas aeruginosa]